MLSANILSSIWKSQILDCDIFIFYMDYNVIDSVLSISCCLPTSFPPYGNLRSLIVIYSSLIVIYQSFTWTTMSLIQFFQYHVVCQHPSSILKSQILDCDIFIFYMDYNVIDSVLSISCCLPTSFPPYGNLRSLIVIYLSFTWTTMSLIQFFQYHVVCQHPFLHMEISDP